jgi:hypothetical protein
VLGIVLAWQVLSRSLVAYLAETSPEAALVLRSNDPVSLVNIAERKLNIERPVREAPAAGTAAPAEERSRIPSFARHASKAARNGPEAPDAAEPADTTERVPSNAADPAVREEIGALARTALARDPLNARALRILGQLADAAEDDQAAAGLMQAAARFSQRESVAVYWLMRESFDRKDYPAAIQFADVLLRSRPQVVTQVMPTLARIAENKDANGELKTVLAGNPPWRGLFFSNLLTNITDARTPLDLLLSIKDTSTPPTVADLRGYLNLLIQNKYYELAYYVWLQFLPREQLTGVGLLFNGSFEVRPSGLPFDWVVTPGSGVTIDLARRPDEPGQRALLVEFGHGRVNFRGIAQMVMLPPGSYQLRGEYKGQTVGRRGLEWHINCASGGKLIAKTPMATGSTPEWTEFTATFTIPETDCRAQEIRLWFDARSASEQLITGSMWYDKLQIARSQ